MDKDMLFFVFAILVAIIPLTISISALIGMVFYGDTFASDGIERVFNKVMDILIPKKLKDKSKDQAS